MSSAIKAPQKVTTHLKLLEIVHELRVANWQDPSQNKETLITSI